MLTRSNGHEQASKQEVIPEAITPPEISSFEKTRSDEPIEAKPYNIYTTDLFKTCDKCPLKSNRDNLFVDGEKTPRGLQLAKLQALLRAYESEPASEQKSEQESEPVPDKSSLQLQKTSELNSKTDTKPIYNNIGAKVHLTD